MHAFFEVIRESLRGARLTPGSPTGTVVFVVLGLTKERVAIRLGEDRCAIEPGDDRSGELTIYTDPAQLEEMITSGPSLRPLRVHGDRRLLDQLASLIRPVLGPISVRGPFPERGA